MRFSDGSNNPPVAEKAKTVKDLVCGMDVDPKSPGTLKTQYKGETYYFCSKMCKESFEANPEKYIPKTTPKKPEKVKDLVCGMDIDPRAPGAVKSVYNGKTYHFCSTLCKKSFDANPEDYVHEGMAPPDKHGTGTGK
jgi:YHS domain-containing protein